MPPNDPRAQAQNYIPARLATGNQEFRVLVHRFSAMGLSFCAPSHDGNPPFQRGCAANLELTLPDGSQFTASGRLVAWHMGEMAGIGRCLLVEMQVSVERKNGAEKNSGFNRRSTPRLELHDNQPRCVVTHPLFTNTRMEFNVCDVSTSGMRLATTGQVVALFPQFVFAGEIVFSDATRIAVRFQVRHVHFDSLTGMHVVGAQFQENDILMLSALSRKLLTTCHVDSEALRHIKMHYVFPARQARTAIPPSRFEVRVVENLDEWQRVLHFRLAAMRAAGQIKDKADMRMVMSPRDTLSTHLVACTADGQIVATATLLQVARLGEQRKLLPYGHHADPAFDAFWDFSQYFLSPLHPGHESLEALLGFALSHAGNAQCPCVVAAIPPEWASTFDAMALAPSVVETSEASAGSASSVYYYLAGTAQERYLTDETPAPTPGQSDNTSALAQFFKRIIRTDS